MDDFGCYFELVRRRRSVRRFAPCTIPRDAALRIVEAGRLAPSGMNRQNREFIIITNPETIATLNRVQASFENVPLVIALVMDPSSRYWVEDAAAATENMLLAIAAMGYDSVWVEGTLQRQEQWAKALLGVPEQKRLFALLPVGLAAEPGAQPEKAPLGQVTHWEHYGRRLEGERVPSEEAR